MSAISTKLRLLFSKSQPIITQVRNSSYQSSGFVCDINKPSVKYETTNDPEDWKYVERILPLAAVPKPILKDEYPSEWKPPSEEALNHPYFVRRTKNYMLPVYLSTTFRGQRRLTVIKHVQGNIWQMEQEIKQFLKEILNKRVQSQVHEFAGKITLHGDHVNAIKEWLLEKKF